MSKTAMNLQDSFLNQVRRENSEVRVLLVNGTLLRGIVKGFDNFTLVLNNRNGQHLIYKHAVAQIVSQRPHVKPEEMTPAQDDAESSAAGGDDNHSESPAAVTAGTHERGPSERPHNRRERGDRGGRNRDKEQASAPSDSAKSQQQQSRSKKEGFNTIDFSSLKLSKES